MSTSTDPEPRSATEPDDRFTQLRARARDLAGDLWMEWTGAMVTGYRYTCSKAFRSASGELAGPCGRSRDQYRTPEAALVALDNHWQMHLTGGRLWNIAGIADHARGYAATHRDALVAYYGDTAEVRRKVAGAVISVAVVQVCPPHIDERAYVSLLRAAGVFCDGRETGADWAAWMLDHVDYPDDARACYAARIRAVAAVLTAAGVELGDEGRTVRELLAFADRFEPVSVALLAVLRLIKRCSKLPRGAHVGLVDRRHGQPLVETVSSRGWVVCDDLGRLTLTNTAWSYLRLHAAVPDE